MLNADDMRAFQKVAALLSFSEAGRVLSVRKSAVSRSIQRLEFLLGVRLFERTTREVMLTEAGKTLLARFDEILNRIDDLVDAAGTLALHPGGRLRLTAGIGFGMEVLTELLPEFSLAFPDIDLSLELTSRTVDLVAEQIDLAVRMGPLRDSNLVATRLGAIDCKMCAAPAYLERRGWPKSLDELLTHDLLAIPGGDGLPRPLRLVDKEGMEHYFQTSSRLTANDPKAIHRMALHGAGIAATARYAATPDIERGRLVEVLPEYTVPAVDVSLVMPAGKERSVATRVFVDFIRQRAAGNPRWFDV